MTQNLEVHVTAGDREEAEKIVTGAVEGRLAACAQISGPITSAYWWEGKLEKDEEFLVVMKTTEDRLDELVGSVKAAHSYDTPEIVAVPIVGGLGDYLEWIKEETAAPSSDG
ncbi:divalent-cation tolerance protein CutA [Actinomadura sp. WAC 06369]|uniref:divalent-cation tolerance protein CutA n=1 Tax=Actinomadura sp. WAC 06369 TaxID=2203193 RepID=UPI000F79527C|nr:divalent-cation tolerance protein CutA [Actinomadura sp. WAC 06369]RSN61911.1 divalent-cation tolerance protein CutA [Actinomadura sp. WAC 06369]